MTDKKFIPALTGIRALCVYLIFFYHLNFFSPELQPRAYTFLNQFYTFLTFFFVLSGFVICHKYYEVSKLKKRDLYNYMVNRVSRVFPILIILISITFILLYREGRYNLPDTIKLYLLNITLLKGFSSDYFLTGIGPSWSMSVEELFYCLSPLIFLLTRKASSLIRFVLLFYAAGVLITFLFSLHPFKGFFSSYIFTGYATFFGRVFEFACGIFLAMIVKGKYNSPLLTKLGKNSLYIGLLIVFTSVTLLYVIARQLNIPHAHESVPGILVNNILMPVGITLIFYSLVFYKSLLQSFLSSKIMVQLGNATYSFYLMHTSFVLSWIYKFVSTNVFITLIVMIAVSFVFHKTVEQPLAVFLRRKLYRKAPVTTPAKQS